MVDGLLREIGSSAKEREDEMEVALKDLNSLIKNANEMVTSSSTWQPIHRSQLAEIGLVGWMIRLVSREE